MKALSLRQPWAWAILHAGKRIENRRWNTHYRGPILIHAAKGCCQDEHVQAIDWMIKAGVIHWGTRWPDGPDAMDRGGIVGRARLVDVIRPFIPELVGEYGDRPLREETVRMFYPKGVDHRWHMVRQYGFVLEDVQALPFRACSGYRGIFDMPEGVIEAAP